MVMGIIGGVYALMVGLIGANRIVADLSSNSYSSVIYGSMGLLLVLAPPIIGLVGAAIVRNQARIGSSLMGVSGIIMVVLTIIFPRGYILVPSATLFVAGTIVGAIGKSQS